MGALVAVLAFPVPRRDASQRALQACASDLHTLQTKSGESTFGIWIQAASAEYTILYVLNWSLVLALLITEVGWH